MSFSDALTNAVSDLYCDKFSVLMKEKTGLDISSLEIKEYILNQKTSGSSSSTAKKPRGKTSEKKITYIDTYEEGKCAYKIVKNQHLDKFCGKVVIDPKCENKKSITYLLCKSCIVKKSARASLTKNGFVFDSVDEKDIVQETKKEKKTTTKKNEPIENKAITNEDKLKNFIPYKNNLSYNYYGHVIKTEGENYSCIGRFDTRPFDSLMNELEIKFDSNDEMKKLKKDHYNKYLDEKTKFLRKGFLEKSGNIQIIDLNEDEIEIIKSVPIPIESLNIAKIASSEFLKNVSSEFNQDNDLENLDEL